MTGASAAEGLGKRAATRAVRVALAWAAAGWALPAPAGPYAQHARRLDRPAAMAAVVKAGAAAVGDVTAALAGPRPDRAVAALGRIALPAATPALARLAGAKDGELRAAVAWAVGRCGGGSAGAVLLQLAEDPYPPARAAALLAMAEVKGPGGDFAQASGRVLTRAVAHRGRGVRLAAVRAIAAGKRKDLFAPVAALLDFRVELVPPERDKAGKGTKPAAGQRAELVEKVVWSEPNARVRHAAAGALGRLKVVDALPALIGAMERETSFNRLAIIGAVESFGPTAAGVCLGRIVPMPYDKETFAKQMPVLVNNGTLAVIAGRLGDERCVEHLLETLSLPRGGLGRDKDLTELLIQTVELLGRFKVDQAAGPLAKLLKDPKVQQLADAAERAIRRIGHTAARPLAANMDNWRVAPVFLRLLRREDLRTKAARGGILKYLAHESDQVRLEATETLGLYLHAGVLDEYDLAALESMYLDPSAEVRACCERWKQKIRAKANSGGGR